MVELLFRWFFAYAFIWWLLWFLVLALRVGDERAHNAKGEACASRLRRKALVVSLLAVVLTTLLQVLLVQRL